MEYGTGKIRKGLEVKDGKESIEQQWLGKRVEFRLWVESTGAFQKAKGKVVRQQFLGYATDSGERKQEYELTIVCSKAESKKSAVVRSVNNHVRHLSD